MCHGGIAVFVVDFVTDAVADAAANAAAVAVADIRLIVSDIQKIGCAFLRNRFSLRR